MPGTFRYSHGLGIGDLSGDGKADVICTGGWWEQPAKADGKTAWKFHPANLGEASADMFALDIDGDKVPDVLSTSAHKFGIWFHKQNKNPKSNQPPFETVTLFGRLSSETHAAHLVDIDGDGLKDLVTGRRWWAHGPKGDAGPNDPAYIYWFEARKSRDGSTMFIPHEVDDDSGIGTQFAVEDVNGDGIPDIIVSNKRGVYVLLQVRTPVDATPPKNE